MRDDDDPIEQFTSPRATPYSPTRIALNYPGRGNTGEDIYTDPQNIVITTARLQLHPARHPFDHLTPLNIVENKHLTQCRTLIPDQPTLNKSLVIDGYNSLTRIIRRGFTSIRIRDSRVGLSTSEF